MEEESRHLGQPNYGAAPLHYVTEPCVNQTQRITEGKYLDQSLYTNCLPSFSRSRPGSGFNGRGGNNTSYDYSHGDNSYPLRSESYSPAQPLQRSPLLVPRDSSKKGTRKHAALGPRGDARVRKPKSQRKRGSTKLDRAFDTEIVLSKLPPEFTKGDIEDVGAHVNRSAEQRRAEVAATCNGKIKRPMNAFMLYRKMYQLIAKKWAKHTNHQVVSKICGISWKNEDDKEKEKFRRMAAIEAANHLKAFPNYKFNPKSGQGKQKRGRGMDADQEQQTEADWESSNLDDYSIAGYGDTGKMMMSGGLKDELEDCKPGRMAVPSFYPPGGVAAPGPFYAPPAIPYPELHIPPFQPDEACPENVYPQSEITAAHSHQMGLNPDQCLPRWDSSELSIVPGNIHLSGANPWAQRWDFPTGEHWQEPSNYYEPYGDLHQSNNWTEQYPLDPSLGPPLEISAPNASSVRTEDPAPNLQIQDFNHKNDMEPIDEPSLWNFNGNNGCPRDQDQKPEPPNLLAPDPELIEFKREEEETLESVNDKIEAFLATMAESESTKHDEVLY